jgi:hypothetical protein
MDRLLCARCREIIGVYEPIWAMASDASERAGSRLTLGCELRSPDSVAVHERCHRPGTASQSRNAPMDLLPRRRRR